MEDILRAIRRRMDWVDAGERAVVDSLRRLSEVEMRAPSALPLWSRATLVAHLCGNALALVNLVEWARTGVETPMYPSAEFRNDQIARDAALSRDELIDLMEIRTGLLLDALSALDTEEWLAMVRTNSGREVRASEIPLMRARELWIHLVDLRIGHDFAEVPADLFSELFEEVTLSIPRRSDGRTVVISPNDAPIVEVAGRDGQVVVEGTRIDIFTWMLGRTPRGSSLVLSDPTFVLSSWL